AFERILKTLSPSSRIIVAIFFCPSGDSVRRWKNSNNPFASAATAASLNAFSSAWPGSRTADSAQTTNASGTEQHSSIRVRRRIVMVLRALQYAIAVRLQPERSPVCMINEERFRREDYYGRVISIFTDLRYCVIMFIW